MIDAVVLPVGEGAGFLIRKAHLGTMEFVHLDHRDAKRVQLDDGPSEADLTLNELSTDVYWRQPDGARCVRVMGWAGWTGPAVCGVTLLQRESGRETMAVYGPGFVEVRDYLGLDGSRLRLPIEAAGPDCEFVARRDALFVACPTPTGVQAAMYDATGQDARYWDLSGASMLPARGERMVVLREGDRVFGHPGAGCGELRIPSGHELVSWTTRRVMCPAVLLRRPNGRLYAVDLSPEREPTPPGSIRRVWDAEPPRRRDRRASPR